MKFNIFLLVISCIVAASVSETFSPCPIEEDSYHNFLENDVGDNMSDFDRSPWSAMNELIQRVMAFTRGAVCIVNEILEISVTAAKFIDEIQNCGIDIMGSDVITKLINTSQIIISMCSDISHINKQICGNSNDIALADNSKTSEKCFTELSTRTIDLKDTVDQMIRDSPSNIAKCFITAVTDLIKVLSELPNKIQECSKLMDEKL